MKGGEVVESHIKAAFVRGRLWQRPGATSGKWKYTHTKTQTDKKNTPPAELLK